MALFSINQIRGHLAMWVCRQHPYHSVEGVDEVNDLLAADAATDAWFGPDDCRMRKFDTWRDLENWLYVTIGQHAQMTKWNTPRSQHGSTMVFSSRYGGPTAEDDFIDIDALIRNVALHAWRETEAEDASNARIDAETATSN